MSHVTYPKRRTVNDHEANYLFRHSLLYCFNLENLQIICNFLRCKGFVQYKPATDTVVPCHCGDKECVSYVVCVAWYAVLHAAVSIQLRTCVGLALTRSGLCMGLSEDLPTPLLVTLGTRVLPPVLLSCCTHNDVMCR